MKTTILVLFIIFWSAVLNAKTNVKFVGSFSKQEVEVGHTFQGTLVFWPMNLSEKFFRSLEGEELGGIFYVAKIYDVETSKNNADAVKLHAIFTVLKSFERSGESRFIHNERWLHFQLPDIKVKGKGNQKGQGFDYINQAVELKKIWIPWIVFVAVVIVGGYLVGRKYLGKIREKNRLRKLHEKWHAYFQKSQTREDFEYIYDNRREWLELIDVKSPPMQHFFNLIYELQFKKSWSDEDKASVDESFEKIRDIFSEVSN